MARLLPKSFFVQLLLGTILVQTLCLGLFIWYTVASTRRGGEQRARQRIAQQLNLLSAVCAVELAQKDMGSLQNILELSRIAPSIEVVRLTDLGGKTLAVTTDGRDRSLDSYEIAVLTRAANERQIFKIDNGQIEAVAPVVVKGNTVALLWLEPVRTAALSTSGEVIRIAVAYGGFALLSNILPILLIVRTMTRPLLALQTATEQVVRDSEWSAFPLPVTSANEAGALTVSFNSMVRQLQQQRRGLLETLALLNSMLRNAPIGFAFFDSDLRYVRVNDFLAELHGFPIDKHLGKTPLEVYPPCIGEPKMQNLKRVFETGVPIRNVQLSGEMPQGSGVQRSWMMHFYPVRADEEVISWVGVIVVEITDQLRADEALRKTEKLAATGRLAASIAHEINNPLEAITNVLYLLQTYDALDEKAADLVATAQAELMRVSEITQQTLRFYRQTTAPTRVNITEILNSIVRLYQSRIKYASVSLVKKFQGEPEVFGFGGELRQLFANLIGNALDAMPLGGTLRLSAYYGHGRDTNGEWCAGVRVFVADTGAGMSEETRRRIFEPFFTTKETTGTGLGLWVSNEIIRKHKGTIQVRSRRGERAGTIFMIFVPEPTDTPTYANAQAEM